LDELVKNLLLSPLVPFELAGELQQKFGIGRAKENKIYLMEMIG
jgi:hypothetical protein